MELQTGPLNSFDRLVQRLSYFSPPKERRKAAAYLREYGEPAVEPLCKVLKGLDNSVRKAAAESLGKIGDARALPPLLDALNDNRQAALRVAAAQALGELKDARAVLPLIDALRDAFTLRSPWLNFVAGVLLLVGSVLLGGIVMVLLLAVAIVCMVILLALIKDAAFCIVEAVVGLWEAFSSLFSKSIRFFRLPRRRDRLCFAIAEALARIAKQSPTPELRAASRRAAHRIRVLTERLKNLPLPASAPEPDTATLPRIADSPKPDVETLPRVQ